MAQFQRKFTQDLTQPIRIRNCGDLGFVGDAKSDIVSVDLYTDGEAYSGGGNVAGAVILPTGQTISLTGSLSGKTASVTLTAACFAATGEIGVGIQIVNGTTKTTVLKVIYNVELFETNSPIDPSGAVALQVGDLVEDIADAIATIPAEYTDLMAAIAPIYSAETAYSVGQYVWYDGNLYRFTVDHPAGTWNAGHVASAVVSEELYQTVKIVKQGYFTDTEKSIARANIDALSGEAGGYSVIPYVSGGYIRTGITGVIDLETPVDNASSKHAVIHVTMGDRFTVSGSGGNANRLWAWIGADGRVTRQRVSSASNPQAGVDFAAANTTATGIELVAPPDAVYLVINTVDEQYSYYGFPPHELIDSAYDAQYRFNHDLLRESRKNPFAFKPYSGPMVSFVFDDLRSDLDLTASIFAEYGYPLCISAIPENLDNVASGLSAASQGYTPGMKMREIMARVVSLGGEVFTHGSIPITDSNQIDVGFMQNYFVKSKETLTDAGFSVRGLIRVGTSGIMVPSRPTELIEEWLIGSYDYSNMGSNAVDGGYHMAENYSVNRVLYSSTTKADIKAAIDAAIISPAWLVYGGHTVSGTGADFPEADLREILAYCQANNVPVVNWSYVFDNFSGSTLGNAEAEGVKFTSQSLSAAQQTQARENIGAISQTELDAAQAAQSAAVGLVANDLSNGSGVFGMAMVQDGRVSHENEYKAACYQVCQRKRTDQDFAELSGQSGAIVMNAKVVLDGSQNCTVMAKTGNFSNTLRLNFAWSELNATEPKQYSNIALSDVVCGALPSYRYLTSNGDIVSSGQIGNNESPAETYQQKLFAGFNANNLFFLVPTMFRIGGTDESPVYLEQTKEAALAYLSDHPIVVYYQTADVDTDQFVYVAVPAVDMAELKMAVDTNTDIIGKLDTPDYTALFRNVACIGDSLTRGYFSAYDSGQRNRDFGYPFALSRMTGMKIWDFGLSGSDPGEWMANATMAAQDFSGFELALVAFGQNIDKPDGGGNYTEDEYKPLYLSVIERLKTANPNMVIFCMSNPGPRSVNSWIQNYVTAANSAPYNYSFVYYLDITNPDYAAHRTDGTHLDPIGYLLLAQTIKDRLTAFIGDNISDFSGMWVPKTLDSIITTPVE